MTLIELSKSAARINSLVNGPAILRRRQDQFFTWEDSGVNRLAKVFVVIVSLDATAEFVRDKLLFSCRYYSPQESPARIGRERFNRKQDCGI
jgi:hypothetical protein